MEKQQVQSGSVPLENVTEERDAEQTLKTVVIVGSCMSRFDWTEEERLAAMGRACGLQLIEGGPKRVN